VAAGAAYNCHGKLIPESIRTVDKTDVWNVSNPQEVTRPPRVVGKFNIDGYDLYLDEGILAGHLLAGWGHVITETISTAWAAERLPRVPLILVPWGRMWVSALPRVRETLRLAGWDDRPLIVASGDLLLGRLHVPKRLVDIRGLMDEGGAIDSALNDVYDRMITRSGGTGGGKKIFLSRPEGHRRAHPHELAVERALIEGGYNSVHGWDLSVEEQIAAVNSAAVLVGFTGSNLHNSVFAKPGVPVLEIRDDRAQLDILDGVRRLQEPLCLLRQQPFTQVDGYVEGRARSAADIVSEVNALIG
jgi:capsular polysaccharide biosynthesis protein